MKNLKKALVLLIALIGLSSSASAQNLNIRNDTDCDVYFLVRYSTSPCSGSSSTTSLTVTANTSQNVSVNPSEVRHVRAVIGGAQTIVSYNCSSWQQTTVGDIECNGNPVTVDFVSSSSVQITD